MASIAHKTTKPMPIKKLSLKKTDHYIGTCRSYDETQPIPSFVRSLTPKSTTEPGVDNCQESESADVKNVEKETEDNGVPLLLSEKCSGTIVETL